MDFNDDVWNHILGFLKHDYESLEGKFVEITEKGWSTERGEKGDGRWHAVRYIGEVVKANLKEIKIKYRPIVYHLSIPIMDGPCHYNVYKRDETKPEKIKTIKSVATFKRSINYINKPETKTYWHP